MGKERRKRRSTRFQIAAAPTELTPRPDFQEGIREIRAGHVELGLSLLKKLVIEQKGTARNINYCIGLLMAGQLDSVMEHAAEAVKTYNSASFYHLRGLCHWLKGDSLSARAAWEEAQHSQYRDASSAMGAPDDLCSSLLIYATSVLSSDNPTRYKNRLSFTYQNCWKNFWPAPLAEYVLGVAPITRPQSYIQDLERRSIEKSPGTPSQERLSNSHSAELAFYQGIVALEQKRTEDYQKAMLDCSSYRNCEGVPEWWIAKRIVAMSDS